MDEDAGNDAAARVAEQRVIADLRARNRSLETALDSARTIGVGVGVLMMKLRISEHEAFALIKELSQRRNHTLRDVAADITSANASGSDKPDLNDAGVPQSTGP